VHNDDVHFVANQFGREVGKPFVLVLGEFVFKDDVLAFNITDVTQARAEASIVATVAACFRAPSVGRPHSRLAPDDALTYPGDLLVSCRGAFVHGEGPACGCNILCVRARRAEVDAMRRRLGPRLSWMVLLPLLLFSPHPAAAQFAGSSSITNWNGNCSGSTRDWWDDMCMAWRKKMGDKGWVQWWRNYELVTGPRYVDPVETSWGNDNVSSGMDWNDAGLVCTHGGWGSGRWNGTLYSSDPDGSCAMTSATMRLGRASNGWLRFMQLSSCNSIRYDQRTQWFDAAGGVHVVTGFHGFMYIGSRYVDEYRDLANEAMTSRGVAKVWLDRMHHVDHWYNAWKTVCPVAIGFGATVSEAQVKHDETYSAHSPHPTPNWMHTRWNSGCDPDDGPPLP